MKLANAFEIKPADRAPYDAEVARVNRIDARLAEHEKLHIFDLSELREIHALGKNTMVNLTAHDHLQASFVNASGAYFSRLICTARGGDRPMTEQDRDEVRRFSPAVADLLTRETRRDFARAFLDLETAEIARFAGAIMRNHASALPRNQFLTVLNVETLVTLFFLCAFRHPRLTAFGLHLPYLGPDIRTIEIAADQLAEDSKASIELAKS